MTAWRQCVYICGCIGTQCNLYTLRFLEVHTDVIIEGTLPFEFLHIFSISLLTAPFCSTAGGRRWHHRARGQTVRNETSVFRVSHQHRCGRCLWKRRGQQRSCFMTEVTTALQLWLRRESVFVCVSCLQRVRLICKLSNRDARTEIKSSSQGLVLLC